jgi:hypothetical protein
MQGSTVAPRKLNIGTEKYTQVFAIDEPGAGNANHVYNVLTASVPQAVLGLVRFQNGPIKEAGVNGVMNEDLMAIVIDRLRGFQSGPYACRENAIALTKLEESLMWLNSRTAGRERRGVEGTHTV